MSTAFTVQWYYTYDTLSYLGWFLKAHHKFMKLVDS